MATNKWQCYACGHIGPTESFKQEKYSKCPNCGSVDDTYEYRVFECTSCHYHAEQVEFFLGQDEHTAERYQNNQGLDPHKVRYTAEGGNKKSHAATNQIPAFVDPIKEKLPYFCTQEVGKRGQTKICGNRSYIQVE